jgi:hypothetical protein
MATSTLGSGTLVLAGTTSGTTTVTATAVAGTTTLTLPAATDTLVGRATTDTLTNKTLTGAAMNGTLGATTPSTVAATTISASSTATFAAGAAGTPSITTTGDTNTGIFFPAADTIAFAEGGAEVARINSSGNVGIGTASPSSRLTTSGTTGTDNGLTIIDTDYSNDTHQIYGNNSLHLSAGTGGAGAILFRTAGTERARFNSTGALVLAGGTTTANGIGITFPATQSASTDANTLDDYEEGTWTPTIVRESTALGAVTYTAQDGKYTKIGRVVYITCSVAWSNIASAGAGANRIDGLPFSSGVSQTNGGATFYSSDGIATNPVLAGLFYNSTIYLRKSANILAVSNLNEAYNNSGTFSFNGYYFV